MSAQLDRIPAAAAVRLGAPVVWQGLTYRVWDRAPKPGTFWLTRDGRAHPEPVHYRDLLSPR
jgi:hypothetical protein